MKLSFLAPSVTEVASMLITSESATLAIVAQMPINLPPASTICQSNMGANLLFALNFCIFRSVGKSIAAWATSYFPCRVAGDVDQVRPLGPALRLGILHQRLEM